MDSAYEKRIGSPSASARRPPGQTRGARGQREVDQVATGEVAEAETQASVDVAEAALGQMRDDRIGDAGAGRAALVGDEHCVARAGGNNGPTKVTACGMGGGRALALSVWFQDRLELWVADLTEEALRLKRHQLGRSTMEKCLIPYGPWAFLAVSRNCIEGKKEDGGATRHLEVITALPERSKIELI